MAPLELSSVTSPFESLILIPYPYAAADHQTFNAQTLVDAGAAVMIADRDVKIKIKETLTSLINDDKKRQQMSDAGRALGKPNAGREIAQRILELIHE